MQRIMIIGGDNLYIERLITSFHNEGFNCFYAKNFAAVKEILTQSRVLAVILVFDKTTPLIQLLEKDFREVEDTQEFVALTDQNQLIPEFIKTSCKDRVLTKSTEFKNIYKTIWEIYSKGSKSQSFSQNLTQETEQEKKELLNKLAQTLSIRGKLNANYSDFTTNQQLHQELTSLEKSAVNIITTLKLQNTHQQNCFFSPTNIGIIIDYVTHQLKEEGFSNFSFSIYNNIEKQILTIDNFAQLLLASIRTIIIAGSDQHVTIEIFYGTEGGINFCIFSSQIELNRIDSTTILKIKNTLESEDGEIMITKLIQGVVLIMKLPATCIIPINHRKNNFNI